MRHNKYNAVKTEVDGIIFDSKYEARIWSELRILEKKGLIKNLQRQVKHRLVVNDKLIATFKPDFVFYDVKDRRLHVVDVKSPPTAKKRDFRLVCKLFNALYGVEVEVWMKSAERVRRASITKREKSLTERVSSA